ncbi:hypothetical protein L6R53_17445 [Myxococcota bacterium]|nr:hypothetical protein [Myxococcota bacterium]
MPHRVLLVGALPAETLPLVRALERPRPLGRRLVEGRLAGEAVAVLTTGVGPRRAFERTMGTLRGWPARGVVNLGTCGSLDDALGIGDVVHVDRLLDEEGPVGALAPLGRPAGTLVTVRRGVWDPATRATLAARGARICDMEAAAVLAACRARGLPLAVVKVVSDQAGAGVDRALPSPGSRPGPLAVARFHARAWRLVDRHLGPLLPALARGPTR